MRKNFFCIFVLVFMINSGKLFSQNNELLSFTVYGNNFLASIALPNTWTVDMAYAKRAGINGFFYLKQYNIDTTPAAILLNLAGKQNEEAKLEEWVEYDIRHFLEFYAGFKSEKLNWVITNKNGYRVIVYSLMTNDGYTQYSAYFDVGLDYFVNIYVTIPKKDKIDEIISDFKKCLENSQFAGAGLNVR